MNSKDVDLALVQKVQAGDKRAFDLLVSKYERKVLRLLSRFIRNPEEAQDVAQEAFIKVYRAIPSFRGDSAFYTWMYRIAINTAKNYLQASNRRPVALTEFEGEEGETFSELDGLTDKSNPEAELASKQIGETVNKAIEKLPEDLKTAIMLREVEGLTYEEIAEVMNCPVGTVRSRIFRAREAVAEKLRPLLENSYTDKRW